MEFPTDPLDRQLIEMCRSGKLLAAIKAYHEATGQGLKESKDYVEALIREYPLDADSGRFAGSSPDEDEEREFDTDALDQQLIDICRAGNVIAAIKVYRDATGQGLKESKDYVDQLIRTHRVVVGSARPTASGPSGGLREWLQPILRFFR